MNISGKLVTVGLLFGTIFLIYLALALLSAKIQTGTPPSQVQEEEPQISEDEKIPTTIAQKIQDYNAKIDNLDNFQEKVPKPIVNLAISFNP